MAAPRSVPAGTTRRHRPRRGTPLACLALVLALAPPAAAQEGDPFGEIGANDFRISFQEGTGSPFDALDAAVAHDPVADEYLVVWTGSSGCVAGGGDTEIHARRVDGATGALLGHPLTLSRMGPACDTSYVAHAPAVAYNATRGEFLVVWRGRDWAMAVGEYDIFGQRLQGEIQVGEDDFRISRMGGNGDGDYQAWQPKVAWNAAADEYLVVWHGDHDLGGLVDDELEIFGQRLDGTGTEIGADDFRISDMGGTGNTTFFAFHPAATWNETTDEYLVVWWGSDDEGSLSPGEYEIFGQLLDADGEEIGANDFRISDMGGTGDPDFTAHSPSVASNPSADEYLVVWSGSDDTGGLIEDEYEIFGQRLDGLGGEVGPNDFRISDMAGTGILLYARVPDVAWSPDREEYLVAWYGDDGVSTGDEVYAQRLDALGAEVGVNDFRVSDMGDDGDPALDARDPAVAWNATRGQFLVVWHGDDGTSGVDEFEIYGQRLGSLSIFADGFESGNTSAWDLAVP
jgi:hypothetical protein